LWQKYPRNNQQHGNYGCCQKIFPGEIAASSGQQKKCHYYVSWQRPNDVQIVERVGMIGKKPQKSYQQTHQSHDEEKRKIKDFCSFSHVKEKRCKRQYQEANHRWRDGAGRLEGRLGRNK